MTQDWTQDVSIGSRLCRVMVRGLPKPAYDRADLPWHGPSVAIWVSVHHFVGGEEPSSSLARELDHDQDVVLAEVCFELGSGGHFTPDRNRLPNLRS
jgi:hypothetical protein